MQNQWTSNKPINGLRHFVLVNKIEEKDQINFLMVSVIDAQISLTISNYELINSGNWKEGWLNIPKSQSITNSYFEYKLKNSSNEGINKIFVNNNSIFNIS